jgi:hypothetical protein
MIAFEIKNYKKNMAYSYILLDSKINKGKDHRIDGYCFRSDPWNKKYYYIDGTFLQHSSVILYNIYNNFLYKKDII